MILVQRQVSDLACTLYLMWPDDVYFRCGELSKMVRNAIPNESVQPRATCLPCQQAACLVQNISRPGKVLHFIFKQTTPLSGNLGYGFFHNVDLTMYTFKDQMYI